MCICCIFCVFFVLLCVFVVSYVFFVLLCVFVVSYVYVLYSYVYLLYLMCIFCTIMCICCILCVFFVLLCVLVVSYVYFLYSYVYLLYLMCICCNLMFIFVVSYVYLLYLMCICCNLIFILTAVGTRCADHVTPLYPQKLALTSPTGGGRSVGIVRSRNKATEFCRSGLLKTLARELARCRLDFEGLHKFTWDERDTERAVNCWGYMTMLGTDERCIHGFGEQI